MPAGGRIANIWHTALSKLGLDPAYRKIFAIGFNKTATKSIHTVFTEAGMTALHRVLWRDTRHPIIHWPYQAFSDGPPDDFTRLDRRFPNALFILNTRDMSDWIDSRLEHYKFQRERNRRPEIRWHQTNVDAVTSWIVERNRHHAQVLRYFASAPSRLLVVNYIREPEAADRIARFIGAVASTNRPHIRSLRTGRQPGVLVNRELIERSYAELGIPPAEWNNDLLCPSLGNVDDLPADTSLLAP